METSITPILDTEYYRLTINLRRQMQTLHILPNQIYTVFFSVGVWSEGKTSLKD